MCCRAAGEKGEARETDSSHKLYKACYQLKREEIKSQTNKELQLF